jgi:hypothetical protein
MKTENEKTMKTIHVLWKCMKVIFKMLTPLSNAVIFTLEFSNEGTLKKRCIDDMINNAIQPVGPVHGAHRIGKEPTERKKFLRKERFGSKRVRKADAGGSLAEAMGYLWVCRGLF